MSRLSLTLPLVLLGASAAFQMPKFEDEELATVPMALPAVPSTALEQVQENVSAVAPEAPTFGLFTRIQEADLPYVASFIKHYSQLGVNRIYFMNSRFEEDHQDLMKYVKDVALPKPTQLKFLSLDGIMHDDPVRTPGLVAKFEDDYMINVDCDEFWVLPEGVPNLPSLVQGHPADIYYFRWVMLSSDDVKPSWSSPYSGALGFPGKWMAHRSLLPTTVPFRMFGHHVVPLNTDSEPKVLGDYKYGMGWNFGEKWNMSIQLFGKPLPAYDSFEPGYLAHFWCRSFYDVVLKTQRFNKGEACKPLSNVTALAKEDTPERLRSLAFLELNTKEPRTVDAGKELLEIDTELEKSLAYEAACEGSDAANEAGIEAFHDAYLGYKNHLAQLMAAGAYPEHWPETALSMNSGIGLTVTDWLYSLDWVLD